MPAPSSYKALWPEDGSEWDSPKDVVLVLHLATLAAGYSPNINLAARPTPTRTSHAFLRCVEPKKPHRTGCQATLLYLEYLTRSKKGNGPCKVHLPPRSKDTQKLCDHHAQPDSGHSECVGHLERATAPYHLEVGTKVFTKREVSLLEAGLKSTGRRAGYAIQSRHTKDVLVKCLGDGPDGPCKWQVRLIPAKDGGEGHTASEIDPVHGCEPKLPPPSKPLKDVLDYFPEVTLKAGLIGKSKRQQVRKKPKPKTTVNTPALTPDWGSDSSDEDGVISDSSLLKKCEDLIKICPPPPKMEPQPSSSDVKPSALDRAFPPPTTTNTSSAAGSPVESALTPGTESASVFAPSVQSRSRSRSQGSSSLSPVNSDGGDSDDDVPKRKKVRTGGGGVGKEKKRKIKIKVPKSEEEEGNLTETEGMEDQKPPRMPSPPAPYVPPSSSGEVKPFIKRPSPSAPYVPYQHPNLPIPLATSAAGATTTVGEMMARAASTTTIPDSTVNSPNLVQDSAFGASYPSSSQQQASAGSNNFQLPPSFPSAPPQHSSYQQQQQQQPKPVEQGFAPVASLHHYDQRQGQDQMGVAVVEHHENRGQGLGGHQQQGGGEALEQRIVVDQMLPGEEVERKVGM